MCPDLVAHADIRTFGDLLRLKIRLFAKIRLFKLQSTFDQGSSTLLLAKTKTLGPRRSKLRIPRVILLVKWTLKCETDTFVAFWPEIWLGNDDSVRRKRGRIEPALPRFSGYISGQRFIIPIIGSLRIEPCSRAIHKRLQGISGY